MDQELDQRLKIKNTVVSSEEKVTEKDTVINEVERKKIIQKINVRKISADKSETEIQGLATEQNVENDLVKNGVKEAKKEVEKAVETALRQLNLDEYEQHKKFESVLSFEKLRTGTLGIRGRVKSWRELTKEVDLERGNEGESSGESKGESKGERREIKSLL